MYEIDDKFAIFDLAKIYLAVNILMFRSQSATLSHRKCSLVCPSAFVTRMVKNDYDRLSHSGTIACPPKIN